MRPLPRLHAITDRRILALPDLGVRAAAIAAAGSGVALHVRDRQANGRDLVQLTRRFLSLAGPPEASVVVNGHPEIAWGCEAQGVQLRGADLSPRDARQVMPQGWIGCSVHGEEEAERAAASGADFLLAGSIYESESHPGQPGQGAALVSRCARFGIPVIAIGGITAERAAQMRDAGAYGVASISALWDTADPAAATLALLDPWLDES